MVDVARSQKVRRKEFGRIVNAERSLHGRTRHAHQSFGNHRIAADAAHLFENDDARPRAARFKRGGEPRRSRTDHDDVPVLALLGVNANRMSRAFALQKVGIFRIR